MLVPYELNPNQKEVRIAAEMSRLTNLHHARCSIYRDYLDQFGFAAGPVSHIAEAPFVPVRFFKEFDLLSVPREEVVKTMTSSGTSGRQSRIFLDKHTALSQTKALSSIMASFIGTRRLPMLVIDCESTITNRNHFSARAAGITGFSLFGSKRAFALDEQLQPDLEAIQAFLAAHGEAPFFIFGFTYLIYANFMSTLISAGVELDLRNGILFHGGGWKKLETLKVSDAEFKSGLRQATGLTKIHNYYGMVEQTGSIFVECEHGRMHASNYSDAIVRDPVTFEVLPEGEVGALQILSTLPQSYPGHSLLTEDVGAIVGDGPCACGRYGRAIRIDGRLARAEVRGCSDSYA